jgi:hypothetical protein
MRDVSLSLFLSPFRVHTLKVKLLFCLRGYSKASLISLFLLLVLLHTLKAQMCGSHHRIFRGGKQKTAEEKEGKKNEIKGQRETGDRRVEEE